MWRIRDGPGSLRKGRSRRKACLRAVDKQNFRPQVYAQDDVLCDDAIGFGDIFDSGFRVRIIEGVRDLAQTVKANFRVSRDPAEDLVRRPRALRAQLRASVGLIARGA